MAPDPRMEKCTKATCRMRESEGPPTWGTRFRDPARRSSCWCHGGAGAAGASAVGAEKPRRTTQLTMPCTNRHLSFGRFSRGQEFCVCISPEKELVEAGSQGPAEVAGFRVLSGSRAQGPHRGARAPNTPSPANRVESERKDAEPERRLKLLSRLHRAVEAQNSGSWGCVFGLGSISFGSQDFHRAGTLSTCSRVHCSSVSPLITFLGTHRARTGSQSCGDASKRGAEVTRGDSLLMEPASLPIPTKVARL